MPSSRKHRELNQVKETFEVLEKEHGIDFFNYKDEKDPYYVLISCILSLRTKDEVTYPAAKRLFKVAKTPEEMLKISVAKIQKLIYPVGFYKRKSHTILGISRKLVEEYESKVPDTIDELLKFKGVGRKTANIVVTFAYRKHGIAVDVHVNRICNRIGWIKTRTPDETEAELRKKLPRKYWIPLNELLVKHGQRICKPISPFCSKCPISKYCGRVGVERHR
ncbi:MAG: endonuclease III [Candidatus Woesearchaeota archaeon]